MNILHEVDTFPEFTLGLATAIVCALAIKEDTYLSSWNPDVQQWEMHTLMTSHRIIPGQQILYKLICTISNHINDNVCPGLKEELAQQPTLGKHKRGPEDLALIKTPVIPSSSLPSNVSAASSLHAGSMTQSLLSPKPVTSSPTQAAQSSHPHHCCPMLPPLPPHMRDL
jgi:hypothetical protein